ncbi:MAG: Iron-sulfur cluster repair protein YtfE [Pseudomonadota bacterium]|jgi:regulator of cell morphogenesis and NO signaling
MSEIDQMQTLSAITLQMPGAARAFEQLGLDYCCGGKRTLSEACSAADIPVERALRLLAQEAAGRPSPVIPQDARELIAHVLDHHHAYSRNALTRLVPLAEKVARVHAEKRPELRGVLALAEAIRDELLPHMLKEERVLFPYVEALAAGRTIAAHFGTVQNPIRVMEAEHEALGKLLVRMRDATDNYTPPADACASHRALVAGLAELTADIHVHAHLENAVLFPAAVRLEAERQA